MTEPPEIRRATVWFRATPWGYGQIRPSDPYKRALCPPVPDHAFILGE